MNEKEKNEKNEMMISIGEKSTENVKMKKIVKKIFKEGKKFKYDDIRYRQCKELEYKNFYKILYRRHNYDLEQLYKILFRIQNFFKRKKRTQTQKKEQKKKKTRKKTRARKRTRTKVSRKQRKRRQINEFLSFI